MSFNDLEPTNDGLSDPKVEVAVYIVPQGCEIPQELITLSNGEVIDPESSLYQRLQPLCDPKELGKSYFTQLSGPELQVLTQAWGTLIKHDPTVKIKALLDIPAGMYPYLFSAALPSLGITIQRYNVLVAELDDKKVQAQRLRDKAPWTESQSPRVLLSNGRKQETRPTEAMQPQNQREAVVSDDVVVPPPTGADDDYQ